PSNGSVINLNTLNSRHYIDVLFNDPNGNGLSEASITDPDLEFKVYRGTTDVTGDLGTVTTTRLSGTTYRYTFTGSFIQNAEYSIEFQDGSWQDSSPVPNKGSTARQTFVAYVPNQNFGSGAGLTSAQSGQ